MSARVLIQIRCKPGTAYEVAGKIADLEIHSALYSTSGEYDLFMIVYVPEGEDTGRFINEKILPIDGIERTVTTLTFNAF